MADGKSSAPNIQDVFLNYARREKLAVMVHLLDGRQFECRIKNFDRFAVIDPFLNTAQWVGPPLLSMRPLMADPPGSYAGAVLGCDLRVYALPHFAETTMSWFGNAKAARNVSVDPGARTAMASSFFPASTCASSLAAAADFGSWARTGSAVPATSARVITSEPQN